MKKLFYFVVFASIIRIAPVLAQPTGYYNGTENKQGEELKAALNDIISGHTVYSYFYSKEIFKLSDADPDNPLNIIQIYTGKSWPNDDYGSGGNQLNREHVWAKSHGNFDGRPPMDGDVHNLKPCDASVNNDKSNLDYDMGGVAHPEAIGCYFSDNNWEPRDQDKGDVARIIFYMDTRYEGENGEMDLTAVDEVNTYPYPEHGKLSTLLQWNLQDPPDEFERNRNNVIFSYQHNRNPFIDNPYFAELIWNNGTLSTVAVADVHQSPEVPNAGEQITIYATISSSSGNITSATIKYGNAWDNLNNTLNMSGSGNSYQGVIPGQNEGATVYYQIEAHNATDVFRTVAYNFYVPKTFTGTLTSIYDVQGQGASSPFNNQVKSITGIVTGNFGDGYFLQDGTGEWNGIYIYDPGRNPGVGDSLVLTGTISEYYEKTEMKSITGYYFISANHTLPSTALITCQQAGEAYEGVLVKVANATCTDENYQANYYMWTVNDGTGNLLIHNTSVFEYEPTEGQVYTITGPLDYDFDEWKIQLRFPTDVQSGGDFTAPQITSVEVITSSILKLQFSEDVERTSAETLSNYSINNGISVLQAAVHSIVKSQVFLTTSELSGGSYNLTVQNIADLVGNVMPQTVIPFSSTGMDEWSEHHFIVYPNPTQGRIYVEINEGRNEKASLNIYNATGVRVFSTPVTPEKGKRLVVDTGGLERGLYILEIRGDDFIGRNKLVVQ